MGMYETVDHHHPAAPPSQGVHSYYHPAMEYTSTEIPVDEASRRTPSPAAVHNPSAPFQSNDHYSPAGTTVVSSVSPTDQSYYHQQAYNMSMAPPQPVASAPYVPHMMTAAPVSGDPMMS
jgi:hypothetical protein